MGNVSKQGKDFFNQKRMLLKQVRQKCTKNHKNLQMSARFAKQSTKTVLFLGRFSTAC